jgi:NAD-dependent deacetylase
MITVDWSAYSRVVVLTGAGVSVASGLRPYRGPGGLWTEVEASGVADAAALRDRPAEVWRFFATARAAVMAAQPNAAHLALVRLEERVTSRGGLFTLITQNVDSLHQRAGSRAVLEIHGTLARSRCTRDACAQPAFADSRVDESCPPCPRCGQLLRPDVVLFGEPLPVEAEHLAKHALRDCDLFMAVGTSGTVTPAASFVRWAEVNGARTLLLNLEPMSPPNPAFQQEMLGRAEELLPRLIG